LLAALFAALLPLSANAQLQVFEFNGTTDTPVGTVVIIGPAAPGGMIATRFHVRNTGSGPAVLQTVSLAGAGFTITAAPPLPYTLAPYTGLASEAEIDFDFSPTIIASYSATLVINTINMILQGTVAPSAVLTVGTSTTPLAAGATVDFGSVDVGSAETRDFVLSNVSPGSITVATLAVTGAGFAGPVGLTAPVQLGPGQTASFQLSFTPQSGTAAQGMLTVGQQTFNLTGQGVGSVAPAQLQIYEFNGTTDTLVQAGTLVNVGTVSPGDTIATRFHVRNTGSGPAVLHTISLAGKSFTIQSAPSLPYTLSPYVGLASEAEIDVDFSPTIVDSYSATLLINATSIVLQGTAAALAVVTVGSSTTPLATGATVKFSADVGSDQVQTFVLSNSGTANINVATLAVSGAGFAGPIGLSAPVPLAPGQKASFQVSFTPQSGTAVQGTLTVDTRAFKLTGRGLAAPPSTASIALASSVGASGQQNSLTIPLASPSPVSGPYGTLTMSFQSSVPGVSDDPAIQFLSGKLRVASVSISAGATSAEIDSQPSIAFQTGTTAGTITFTLVPTDGAPQSLALTIPPSQINLDDDTFSAVRLLGSLNVSFGGFDNTYSASQIAFTFYDLNDLPLPQGAIDVDAASSFHQYFSTTTDGGTFQVLAEFPVTGSTALIGFVTAQITNSQGASITLPIPFGN
jgi:hypothetical protein